MFFLGRTQVSCKNFLNCQPPFLYKIVLAYVVNKKLVIKSYFPRSRPLPLWRWTSWWRRRRPCCRRNSVSTTRRGRCRICSTGWQSWWVEDTHCYGEQLWGLSITQHRVLTKCRQFWNLPTQSWVPLPVICLGFISKMPRPIGLDVDSKNRLHLVLSFRIGDGV